MNQRAVVAWVIVLAIVALIVIWIARNTYWDEITVPMPLRNEAARNPFYAAQRFVEHLGATAELGSLFRSSCRLNAVLVVSSWHWDLTEGRRSRMEALGGGRRTSRDRSLTRRRA